MSVGKIPFDKACEETVNKETETPGGTKGFRLKTNFTYLAYPLLLVRHRASTKAFHRTPFIAIFSTSPHVFPMPLQLSVMTVRHQDSFGLQVISFSLENSISLLLSEEVFCGRSISTSFHFHFLCFILLHLPVQIFSANSSSFVMIYGQNIPSIWRSLLLTNVCILESRVLVSRQVSDP